MLVHVDLLLVLHLEKVRRLRANLDVAPPPKCRWLEIGWVLIDMERLRGLMDYLVASRSRHVDTLLSLLQHLLQTSLRLLHIILRLLHLADADARACGLISLGHLLLPQKILELLDLELLR